MTRTKGSRGQKKKRGFLLFLLQWGNLSQRTMGTNNSLSKSYDAIQREGKKATFHIKTEAAMPMMPPVSSAV